MLRACASDGRVASRAFVAPALLRRALSQSRRRAGRPPACCAEATPSKEAAQSACVNATPTARELSDLSLACGRLWELDVLRLSPGRDYELDLQVTTYHDDRAARPLFKWVDQSTLEQPVYRSFLSLLDNYDWRPGAEEVYTDEEMAEIDAFLDDVMATPCMAYTYAYLTAKEVFRGTRPDFKARLSELWFAGYKRGRRGRGTDSSAFEHVFVGETKRDEGGNSLVIGSHSWLAWYFFEKEGVLNYYDFKRPRGRRSRNGHEYEKDHLLTVVFEFHGALKPVSTGFVGTSPAFELSLYTLAFLCGQEETLCELGGVATAIHVHRHRGDKIGTCHPEEAVRRDTDGRLYTYPEYVAFYGSDAPAAWAAAAHP